MLVANKHFFMKKIFSQPLTENDFTSAMMKKIERTGFVSEIPKRVWT